MITFDKPTNLNGSELRKELNAGGVTISDAVSSVMLSGDELSLDIAAKDTAKATPIVAAHNGTVIAPDNLAAKAALLARLGITADEAKLLLGGN
jgi:hypothetical protein